MVKKSYKIILLAAVFLIVGFAGIAAFWMALLGWLNTAGASPLASLFTFTWSCTFIITAILTWHRSRFAAFMFLAAMGLLFFLLLSIFPGGQLLLFPLFAVVFLFAFLGYRYLRRAGEPAA